MNQENAMNTQQVDALEEKLVQVNRVAKVVKGLSLIHISEPTRPR